MTNPPDNPSPVPPADDPRQDSPTTPEVGARRPAWYRRLPGHLGLWVAGLALVAGCVIGSCGFIAGAVVSHGFGDHGGSSGDRWGHERQRGGDEGANGENNAPQREQGTIAPTPVPRGTVTAPAQPSTPSPAASPTA